MSRSTALLLSTAVTALAAPAAAQDITSEHTIPSAPERTFILA
jgi:hypothetical protein